MAGLLYENNGVFVEELSPGVLRINETLVITHMSGFSVRIDSGGELIAINEILFSVPEYWRLDDTQKDLMKFLCDYFYSGRSW